MGFEPGQPKRMSADGAPVERMLDVQERPLLSVFMPDRLELVKGAPGGRRAHLDQLVSAIWPLRASARREYSRVLAAAQRPAGEHSSGSRLAGDAAELGPRACRSRGRASREPRSWRSISSPSPFLARAAQLGLSGEAELAYRPRSRAKDEEEFLAELAERRRRSSSAGFSAHGPHRDELVFSRDGRDLRPYGSQGEQRLALLALLLAERDVLAEERRRMPLLLLDDVMSELDSDRRELLAGELAGAGQSVIATTDLAHVPGAAARAVTRLRISPGVVLQEALAA